MKKGILISGILWGIFTLITAAVFFLVGAIAITPEAMKEIGGSQADLEMAAKLTMMTMMITGGILVLGGIYSFVLAGLRNKEFGKGAGITLGVFGIIFGATVPAILTIVDSAMNRK